MFLGSFIIEQKYNIETKVHAMDFTKGDDKDYQALQALVAPVNVTVLGMCVFSVA